MSTQTQTQLIENCKIAHEAEWSPVAAIRPDFAQTLVDAYTARYPQAAQVSNGRLAAAARIMCKIGARKRGDHLGQFLVQSESNPRGFYVVDLLEHTCTCPDHPGITARGGMCKHRLAIGLQIAGKDWLAEDQRAEHAAYHRQFEAQQAASKAWAEVDRLTDQYLAISEHYSDYFSPPVEAARVAMLAATHEALRLQQIADNLSH